MRPNRLWNNPSFWVAVGAILVAVIPILLAAAAHDPAEVRRRAAIEQMTKSERAELEQNYGEYESLSEDEREELRRLHSALQEALKNEPENGPLHQALNKYQAWSSTLSPWQRLALRNEPDPQKRLELVRTFRSEQEKRRADDRERELRHEQYVEFRLIRQIEQEAKGAIDLDRSELKAMMAHVEDSLPGEAREQAVQVDSGPKRYLEVLIAALQQHVDHCSDESSLRDHESCEGSRRWPAPGLMSKLVSEIEGRDERQWFESLVQNGEGQPNLLASLSHAIGGAWWRSQFGHDWSPEERDRKYQALDEAERAKLEKLSPEERKRALRRELFREHAKKMKPRFEKLQSLIATMEARGGFVPLPHELRESRRRIQELTAPGPPRSPRPRP